MRPFEQVEVLRAACCVAGADGEISEREQAVLTKLADESGVGEASLSAMVERAKSDCAFCDEQFKILKTDPLETAVVLLRIASSDGSVGEEEFDVLKSFASKLGITEEHFATASDRIKE